MGRRGNSGYTNPDRRFSTAASSSIGYSGSLGLTQHYLERLGSDLPPVSVLEPYPGMAVWTRADKLVTLDEFNKVTNWGDLSGNGNNWIPTGGSKGPPNFDSSNSFVNDLPTIDFSSNDRMDMNYSSTLGVSILGFTLYMVTKKNSYPNNYNFLINHCSNDDWDDGWGILEYDNDLRFWVRDWSKNNGTEGRRAEISSLGIASSNANIYKMVCNRSNIVATIIGPDAATNTSLSYTLTVNVPTSTGLQLNGGRGGASNYTTSQDVAEIIYYKGTLDTDEATQTEDYLKDRYGFT